MVLEITFAQESDIDRLMEIQFSAFEHDPYHEALYPGDHYSPANRKSAGERTIKHWREDPTLEFLKCTRSEDGVIVGYAQWNIYSDERPESEWNQEVQVEWATGRQREIAKNFLGANAAMRKKVWGGRRHVLLNLLCIHKDCQRQGAGTLLVQWGLSRSEELGLPAYLEASPDGYHLYLKLGFHQIDTVVVKAEEYDGDQDKHYIVMLRFPQGTSKATLRDRSNVEI